ncbi:hypothetical protein EJ02DRAFT_460875 [Clathrospora elynae]|uniref:Uncharacterized protein n=1 Tax=Clathrospora elynae TaxID=706981 RepID=A0A6A5S1Y6_9PLEO|nr:hypothetical protein EJ02DRAFT_461020 [Clathrospora elynae]KAF1934855.1 hypothetical protein EJ02DRAFT_460875 [Clathrospora elynae]
MEGHRFCSRIAQPLAAPSHSNTYEVILRNSIYIYAGRQRTRYGQESTRQAVRSVNIHNQRDM